MNKRMDGKNPKRALRRTHRKRMIARALRVVRTMWSPQLVKRGDEWRDYNQETIRQAIRFHDHLKVCSCWMCGNPRRHFRGKRGLKFSDIRSLVREHSAVEEWQEEKIR